MITRYIDRNEETIMSEEPTWAWLPSTKALQEKTYGYAFPLEGEQLADYLTWNHSAAVLELSELLSEVGWKPWAEPRGWVNRDKALTELVDVLHFIGNMAVAFDFDETELWAAYRAKQAVNRRRQTNSYDGVTGKCPVCKRATDDAPSSEDWGPYCGEACLLAVETASGSD